MRQIMFALCAVTMAACSGGVVMQNPTTGQTVECGPYFRGDGGNWLSNLFGGGAGAGLGGTAQGAWDAGNFGAFAVPEAGATSLGGIHAIAAVERERMCVQDFKAQGYVRR